MKNGRKERKRAISERKIAISARNCEETRRIGRRQSSRNGSYDCDRK